MSGVYRVGAEQEMTVYAKNPNLERKLPAAITKVFGKLLPDRFKERHITSWAKLYNEFVDAGGFPSKHTKDGAGYREPLKFDDVWIREGKYYGDGYERDSSGRPKEDSGHYPEFCTFPTRVRKGFAEEATKAVMAQRAKALRVAGDEGKVDIHDMHYNISGDGLGFHFRDLPETLAPAYALMLFSDDNVFYGFQNWYDCEKGRRIEIKAPALMDPEQMEAAFAFVAGTMIGMSKRGPPLTRMMLWEKPHRSSSWITFRLGWDYEEPIMRRGPKAKLRTTEGKLWTTDGTMTALEYFRKVFMFYKDDIREVATEKEMRLLEELADGRREFEVKKKPSHAVDADYIMQTTGKTIDEAIADYKPTCEAELFSDASTDWWYKKIGNKGLTRTVKKIGWEEVTFQFSYKDCTQTIQVPLERMEEYLKLEGGLGAEKDPLQKLAEWTGVQVVV